MPAKAFPVLVVEVSSRQTVGAHAITRPRVHRSLPTTANGAAEALHWNHWTSVQLGPEAMLFAHIGPQHLPNDRSSLDLVEWHPCWSAFSGQSPLT